MRTSLFDLTPWQATHGKNTKDETMDHLTAKELAVLRCTFDGLSNKETAAKLGKGYALRTVEQLRRSAMKKLGVDSFALLMRRLCAEGWEADQQQVEKVA